MPPLPVLGNGLKRRQGMFHQRWFMTFKWAIEQCFCIPAPNKYLKYILGIYLLLSSIILLTSCPPGKLIFTIIGKETEDPLMVFRFILSNEHWSENCYKYILKQNIYHIKFLSQYRLSPLSKCIQRRFNAYFSKPKQGTLELPLYS